MATFEQATFAIPLQDMRDGSPHPSACVLVLGNAQAVGPPGGRPQVSLCNLSTLQCSSRFTPFSKPLHACCTASCPDEGVSVVRSSVLSGGVEQKHHFRSSGRPLEQRYDKKLVARLVGRCFDECKAFYDRCIGGRTAEEVSVFSREGCTPSIVPSELRHDACRQSVLAIGSESAGGRGSTTFGLAPVPDLSTRWAEEGGDPHMVPMQLSDCAAASVNKVLRAITYLERGLLWHNRFGGRCDAEAEFRRLQDRAHRCVVAAVGPFCTRRSRVYLDRFNPTSPRERASGVACTRSGSSQSIGGLLGSDCRLHPVVLAQFDSALDEQGLGVQLHIRTVPDMQHIIRNPTSFAKGGHCVLSDEVHTDSHSNVGRRMRTMHYLPMDLHAQPEQPSEICSGPQPRQHSVQHVYAADTTAPALLSPLAVYDWTACVDRTGKALLVQVEPPPFKPAEDDSDIKSKLREATVLWHNVAAKLQMASPELAPPAPALQRLNERSTAAERSQAVSECTEAIRELCAMALQAFAHRRCNPRESINYLCQCMYDCDDPNFTHVLHLVRVYNDILVLLQDKADRALHARYPKVRPMFLRHQAQLGGVTNAVALAATRTRGVVLVQCGGGGDLVLLMINRNIGTDPEYFSTVESLQPLKKASSVKACLEQHANEPVVIHRYNKVPCGGEQEYGQSRSAKHDVAFAVEWSTAHGDSRVAILSVDVRPSARVQVIHGHTQANPDWGIHPIVFELKMQ